LQVACKWLGVGLARLLAPAFVGSACSFCNSAFWVPLPGLEPLTRCSVLESRRICLSLFRCLLPLTPALSLAERENQSPRHDKSRRPDAPSDGQPDTLSSGERARVRGNWAHVVSTSSGCLKLLHRKLGHAWQAWLCARQHTPRGILWDVQYFGLSQIAVALRNSPATESASPHCR